MLLAYNETSIPGTTLSERLKLAKEENLALEVANQGNFDFEVYRDFTIATVQAYAMHDFHPLHPNSQIRDEAFRHVRETLEIAAKLQVPHIVTVCGFGYDLVDRPFDRCFDFFSSLIPVAKAAGVRIAIEPLSPLRSGAMRHPDEIVGLVEMLNEPSVFSILLDTGHLVDSGIELNSFFASWNRSIAELQLKGPRSAPPSPAMPVVQWLKALPELPALICPEHRQAILEPDFRELVKGLRSHLVEML